MRGLAAALLCAIAACGAAASAQQAPAAVDDKVFTGEVTTRWGREVTPENTWRSYPRPQFQRDKWLNLNGAWDYAIAAPLWGAEGGP